MKKKKEYHLFFGAVAGLSFMLMIGCKKDENIKASKIKPEKILFDKANSGTGNRLRIVQLSKDTVYINSGSFTREAGEELVIEEGTLIKGGAGITIQPGGVIVANGTRENPIVFTSNRRRGVQGQNWSGITIQGKSVDNLKPGPKDSVDFSGSLLYTRIEFATLTLESVGSRSIIENVMVSYAEGSAFNILGGSFNARNLVSYACGGSADYYITRGYSGRMQNLLAYRHPYFGGLGTSPPNSLAGVFVENSPFNPGGARPFTNPFISNLTVVGPNAQNGSASAYADTATSFKVAALVTTGSSCFSIRNSVLIGFPSSAWRLDDRATAENIQLGNGDLSYSLLHANLINRVFYLLPGTVTPFLSNDFRNYMLQPVYQNRVLPNATDVKLTDMFNYNAPGLVPMDGSPLLTEPTNFKGPIFDNVFFNKVAYKGAMGKDNWMSGWTNFTPLKTNYNFSE
jgi:hypothetical protein